MVRKRDEGAPAPGDHVPRLPTVVEPKLLGGACPAIDIKAYDFALAGSPHRFGDYAVGEKIDHVDGITVEEAEHMTATRLYQNTARIHFDAFTAAQGRFGKRLIYGGHVISLARAISFNGLANAFHIAAINGGRHVSPLFAGGTVFAWSEVLAVADLPGRSDVGALRLRTVATRGSSVRRFPLQKRRGIRPRRPARPGLLGVDPALIISPLARAARRPSPRRCAGSRRRRCGRRRRRPDRTCSRRPWRGSPARSRRRRTASSACPARA